MSTQSLPTRQTVQARRDTAHRRYWCWCPVCKERAEVWSLHRPGYAYNGDGVSVKCADHPGHDLTGYLLRTTRRTIVVYYTERQR